MSYRSYLSRSPSGAFYFRLRLMPAVAEKLGVKELRRSLQTSDRIQARKKALELFQVVKELSLSAQSSEVLQPVLERFGGIKTPLQQSSHAKRKSLSVEDGVTRYRAENMHLWTEKTAQEVGSILDRFEVCASTSRAHAVQHKAQLAHLHPKTQNKHLQRLHGLFEYLRINGYVQGENPFEGLTLRLRPFCLEAEARTAWSDADCQRLLLIEHWLPRLGLFTGARINELAQLRLDDIEENLIHIRADGPGQRLKNLASKRVIPIHSELVRLGFLQYVAERSRQNKTMLFDYALGRDGYGQAASRWFSRLRRKHSYPDFHSLRHTVATKLREADVPEDIVAELLGHSKGSTMAFRRYAKASSLERLRTGLEYLRYDCA